MPTFSIIIPFYNLERYVSETLNSVLAAAKCSCGRGGVEIICVDDGSTDGTGQVLDGWNTDAQRRGVLFRVIHKPNGGEGSARNVGLDAATGEWICFLDGDDIWAPTFLKDLADGIAANPEADMVSVRQWDFHDGEAIVPPPHEDGMAVYDTSSALSSDLFMVSVCCTAYRRAVFGDLQFTAHCIGADRVYTMKCLARSRRAVVLAARDYGYRLRGDSMAHGTWSARKIESQIDFSRLCVDVLAQSGKSLGAVTRRQMASGWLEQAPTMCVRHSDQKERAALLAEWRNGVRRAGREVVRFLPPWFRFTRWCFGAPLPLALTVRVLCVWPIELKRRGLHR